MARDSLDARAKRLVTKSRERSDNFYERLLAIHDEAILERIARSTLERLEESDDSPSIRDALHRHRELYSSEKPESEKKNPWSPQNRISGTGEN